MFLSFVNVFFYELFLITNYSNCFGLRTHSFKNEWGRDRLLTIKVDAREGQKADAMYQRIINWYMDDVKIVNCVLVYHASSTLFQ